MERTKLMKFISMMHKKEEKQSIPTQTLAFIPYPMTTQMQQKPGGDEMIMKMLKKMMFKKMFRKMMKEKRMSFDDMVDEDEYEEDYDMDFKGLSDMDVDLEDFLKAVLKSSGQATEALRRNVSRLKNKKQKNPCF